MFNPFSEESLKAAWRTVLAELAIPPTYFRAEFKPRMRQFALPGLPAHVVRRLRGYRPLLWETKPGERWVDAEGGSCQVAGIGTYHEDQSKNGLIHVGTFGPASRLHAAVPIGVEVRTERRDSSPPEIYLIHGLQIEAWGALSLSDLRWVLAQ
jgi:hypothetical protein